MFKIKKLYLLVYALVVVVSVPQVVSAMHIMEGFLPPVFCITWGVLCIPSFFIGIKRINQTINKNQQAIIFLAMACAFTFVLSALKIPSVTGSSSHMTGLGFATIMFGPSVATVMAAIVLLFQATLLAHGGLTTLGANTFSMGIVGPIIVFLIYAALSKSKTPNKIAIFIAVALGDLATYVVTSLQLALAYPSEVGGIMESFLKFAGIFAITQVPLAIIEGILTVILLNFVTSYGKDAIKSIGKDVIMYE